MTTEFRTGSATRMPLMRLFGDVAPTHFDHDALTALGNAMESRQARFNPSIPAGHTYFGQFVDHDMTFMPRSPLREHGDALEQQHLRSARSPKLDLDSVYGVPNELGAAIAPNGLFRLDSIASGRYDLPRGFLDPKARIADARNDENLLVAQIQVGFMRYHNHVQSTLLRQGGSTPRECFEAARGRVVADYHSVIVHDLLAAVLYPPVWEALVAKLADDRACFLRPPKVPGEARQIPLEFAAAAGRFGHALVRDSYLMGSGRAGPDRTLTAQELLQRSGTALAPEQRIDPDDLPEWRHFFGPQPPAREQTSRPVQKAQRLGPGIVSALMRLGGEQPNLAVRNLQRGDMLGLPCGQDLCKWLLTHSDGRVRAMVTAFGMRVLSKDEIRAAADGVGSEAAPVLIEYGFDQKTPLWYYLLCEAWTFGNGRHFGAALGPLGSLIVADTMLEVLRGSAWGSARRVRDVLDAPNATAGQSMQPVPSSAGHGGTLANSKGGSAGVAAARLGELLRIAESETATSGDDHGK